MVTVAYLFLKIKTIRQNFNETLQFILIQNDILLRLELNQIMP